jgi:hypothetical protein
MIEKQLTLNYTNEEMTIALTVVRATARIGMERSILIYDALDANKVEKDRAVITLHRFTYPDLISCSKDVTGLPWPLTFEQFLELPDDLTSQWESLVYRVNPHWLPMPDDKETDEKKELASESA